MSETEVKMSTPQQQATNPTIVSLQGNIKWYL